MANMFSAGALDEARRMGIIDVLRKLEREAIFALDLTVQERRKKVRLRSRPDPLG
jgi:RNase P/RNase MRP subunit POP5